MKGYIQSLADQCKVNDIQLTIPSPKLSTDNAAMMALPATICIGEIGELRLALNGHSNIDLRKSILQNKINVGLLT